MWRTSIGAADTPAGGIGDEITHNLLTLAGDRIYFNTNLGLVAALDADSGEIAWLAKYPRLTGKSFTPGYSAPLHFDRDPSPCLVHEGLVIVAPSDTPDVFALDAETGKTVWVNNQLADAIQVLGVVGQRLIVSGNRLASLDLRSGKTAWIWPESSTAGIRGMGRGLIAGKRNLLAHAHRNLRARSGIGRANAVAHQPQPRERLRREPGGGRRAVGRRRVR